MSKMLPDLSFIDHDSQYGFHRSQGSIVAIEVQHPDYENKLDTEITIYFHFRFPTDIGTEMLHNARRLYPWRTKRFIANNDIDMNLTIEKWTKEQFDDIMKLFGLTDEIVMKTAS